MIVLKVIKNHGFTLSLENTFFKKPNWPPAVLGLINSKGESDEANKWPYYRFCVETIVE